MEGINNVLNQHIGQKSNSWIRNAQSYRALPHEFSTA